MLGQPNLNIKIDRAKAARYGLNTGDVNTVVQAAMGGAVAITGAREATASSISPCASRPNIETASSGRQRQGRISRRRAGANAYIPLKRAGDDQLGFRRLLHLSRNDEPLYIPIKFSVRGRDLGSTVAEAQERIAKNVKLPTGIASFGPASSRICRLAKKRLAIFVPLSLG
jgi:heavy metal efflux system protein